MASKNLFFLLLLSLSAFNSYHADTTLESQFFNLFRNSASGHSLSKWEGNSPCNYTGIACDDHGNVINFNISGWFLSGKFPNNICSYLPKLSILRLDLNTFDGGFPDGITNCSSLEELNVSSVNLTGTLPDLSSLKSLRILDLSYNRFSGDFPVSITNLTNLVVLCINMVDGFNYWELPPRFTRLVRLETMILTTCNLRGELPGFIGNMTSLIDLQLSGNFLTGHLPRELGLLRNLQHLELYYNHYLSGHIPGELGNLTKLRDLDMSVNSFTGRIPESICRLPNLHVLQLYKNTLVGEIPGILANSMTLRTLSLYGNSLTGEIPKNLGMSSALHGLDLSENGLSGKLPDGLCSGGELRYLLVLQNMFSGEIPESYGDCKSIVRFRISSNNLEGRIPEGVLSLPNASIIDVAYNNFTGSISREIMNAKNLSELLLQGNRLSGTIPPEIALAEILVKIDLSNNLLTGPIPSEISSLRWLNLLFLQDNILNSSIPESLSSLESLDVLDLSGNQLTGHIPEALSKLLPNSLNFSNNRLSGAIPNAFIKGGLLESFSGNPGLCLPTNYDANFPVCHQPNTKKKMNCVWLIGIIVVILILGTIMVIKRWFNKNQEVMETEDNTLSSSFFSYDVKSFHRMSFNQREILEAMVEKNIVGYGGSGTVYKIELHSGEVVAVKELWSRGKDVSSAFDKHQQLILDREMKTEVETLGNIRHKNIVKLYCHLFGFDCSLLVYEYMPNGNLWDALHHCVDKVILDWPTRYQIALGIAQGLAYLHHDLMTPIIHRDIKSANILLDGNYHPKVADFGIAKVLRARSSKDLTTTVIAGTYGYLAPEYAYSFKTTTKCDVYSFGVVLMELVTGKRPVEAEFGENKNIINWVTSKGETEEAMKEVLDKRVSGSYEDDMIKVLHVAICCTCSAPALRPAMNDVVQMLTEGEPCSILCAKSIKSV